MKHTCFCALVCPPKFLVHYAVLYFSISNATQSHFSGRYKWKLFGLCAFYRTYVSSWHFILVIVLDKLHPTPAGLGGKYVYLVYGHLGDIQGYSIKTKRMKSCSCHRWSPTWLWGHRWDFEGIKPLCCLSSQIYLILHCDAEKIQFLNRKFQWWLFL